jgi:hypothetical protein
MSSFTDDLTVTKVRQKPQTLLDSLLFWKVKPKWVVARSFRYYVGAEGSDDYIDVEPGDTTDFASIPRIFWPILPPDGEYTQAAVLHDKLCRAKLRTKKERDLIFLEAMTVLEVPAWKRNVMYWAVKTFGP